ncbi:DUF6086 family protein [Streptomyces sp. MBT62]|uniref:DUF6086 family protein n=1 Tax=Streptomyces sp. MBT62 TaxID=2800410 RepID=UPI00190A7AE6|nr:DUF6086 family protein [Streptomyces sp. MBT62]MBK3572179.1 hypothetical protein [Streptomyces sp. MBT62]
MSQYYEVDGESVWNPGTLSSTIFLADVRFYEDLLGVPSGLGPMRNDECPVDPPVLGSFVDAVLEWWDRTGSLVIDLLAEGFIATLVTLAEKTGTEARWPERCELFGRADRVRLLVTDLRGAMRA